MSGCLIEVVIWTGLTVLFIILYLTSVTLQINDETNYKMPQFITGSIYTKYIVNIYIYIYIYILCIYKVLYTSTFLWLLNNPRNSTIDWVFKLNLCGAKQYKTGFTLKPNLNLLRFRVKTLNHNYAVKNDKIEKKPMSYSIPSIEILLILRYQHITTQIKQYLTCKHDIL